MAQSIGLVVTEHVALAAISENRLSGELRVVQDNDALHGMPAEEMLQVLADEIKAASGGAGVDAVGLAFPGIIRCGVIEDSPNLVQLKGYPLEAAIRLALEQRGIVASITVSNDADATAAGIAAAHGHLDKLVRVWTLGNGIGFGRYPLAEGVWEGGHMVVSLDSNEKYCGCGGRGHLEGIMGHRAMRLRFLDLEPDEVFDAARSGNDPRCVEFVLLWHRALAAATASAVHMGGAGKFYISGPNARFVNLDLLNRYMQEMVKMSPLQGYVFEIIPKSDELAVIGAAINAQRASG